MNSKDQKSDPGIVKTLSSVKFGIIVLSVIVLVAVVGTIIPQGRSADFYEEHYGHAVNLLINVFRFDITYRSPIFIGLLFLLGLNLVLCSLIRFPAILRVTFRPDITPDADKIVSMPVNTSVKDKSLDEIAGAFAESGIKLRKVDNTRLFGEKWRIGYLGSSFVHLSLLIFLLGGLVSLVSGRRGYIILENGQSASEAILWDESTIPLGFEIKLNSFEVEFYEDDPGRPKSYTSFVTVNVPDKKTFNAAISVNHPFMRNGFTIYQSSYGVSEDTQAERAVDDTALVEVRLKGIFDDMPPITTLEMVTGTKYPVPGFGDSIKVSIAELHRDFKRLQSLSGTPNPAVKVNILVNDEVRWSVYAFQNFPGMNMPMTQDIDFLFTMLDIKTGGGSDGSADEEYYTVLGVVKDSGVPLMWIAAFMIMVGLSFSFYLRPKRIWVYNDNGNVIIGASTRGDTQSLDELIRRTIRK